MPRLYADIIPGMDSTNERRRYNVTSSLIGWAHTQNDSWYGNHKTPIHANMSHFNQSTPSISAHQELLLIIRQISDNTYICFAREGMAYGWTIYIHCCIV